jgi:hypothetical protein
MQVGSPPGGDSRESPGPFLWRQPHCCASAATETGLQLLSPSVPPLPRSPGHPELPKQPPTRLRLVHAHAKLPAVGLQSIEQPRLSAAAAVRGKEQSAAQGRQWWPAALNGHTTASQWCSGAVQRADSHSGAVRRRRAAGESSVRGQFFRAQCAFVGAVRDCGHQRTAARHRGVRVPAGRDAENREGQRPDVAVRIHVLPVNLLKI